MSELFEIVEGDRVKIVKDNVHPEIIGEIGEVCRVVGHSSLYLKLDRGGYVYVIEDDVELDFSKSGSYGDNI